MDLISYTPLLIQKRSLHGASCNWSGTYLDICCDAIVNQVSVEHNAPQDAADWPSALVVSWEVGLKVRFHRSSPGIFNQNLWELDLEMFILSKYQVIFWAHKSICTVTLSPVSYIFF